MFLSLTSKGVGVSMADKQPQTEQEWAWYYLKNRLGTIPELLKSSENLPEITTFAGLTEGALFIRLPMFRIKDGKLVFQNTELYRKTRAVRYAEGGSCYSAMRVISGSLHEIPDNEPVIMIK